MSPVVVRAVRRYQRLLVTEAQKLERLRDSGWSYDVLRAERVVITQRAVQKALRHLQEVLVNDPRTPPPPTEEK